ncbi:MAG: hypothetical protein FJ291_10505 [Planctomycetes bacterium]|nr:hypothetical protein [Planctomycetota bacterium]
MRAEARAMGARLVLVFLGAVAVGCGRHSGPPSPGVPAKGMPAAPARPTDLAGTEWLAVFEDATGVELLRVRFWPEGGVSVDGEQGWLVPTNSSRWEALADKFHAVLSTLDKGWYLDGAVRGNQIEGVERRDGKERKWRGVRVARGAFTFPPAPEHVDAVIRLHKDLRDKWVAEEGGEENPWRMPGFVFQIVAPKEYAGKLIAAHWDGPLADPLGYYLKEGKLYAVRIPRKSVGNVSFGWCLMDLAPQEIGAEAAETARKVRRGIPGVRTWEYSEKEGRYVPGPPTPDD